MKDEQFEDDFVVASGSPDFRSELAAQLAELAPEIIADGKVDVAKLQELLGEDVADSAERFGLFWPGKKNALRVAQAPTTATLRPDIENSKDWDTTQNVFIEGDNLEVLKILQKHYHNKIKMIYIDPPYNTGKDFVYPDNFKEGLESYLEWTRQVNEEGKKLSSNSETEGRYHSNWLNMMYPRLKLARNLLTDDGVMFISIGKEEVHNLRQICSQIYGESNVIATISREQKSGSNQGEFIAPQLDFILVCARNTNALQPFVLANKELEREVEKSLFQSSLDPLRGCVNQRYWIEAPDGSFIIPPGNIFPDTVSDGSHIAPLTRQDKVWRWSYSSYLGQKDQLRFKQTGRGTLLDQNGKPSKWNVYSVKSNLDSDMRPRDYVFGMTNSSGSAELKSLGLDLVFDNPKPSQLIQYLFALVADNKNDLLLDFFAGSSSAAQAVMTLNSIDQGNRRFIMVQLPEPTDKDSEALRVGFTNIADISRERIRRAGAAIVAERDGQLDSGEKPLDVGFRSYKLNASNFAKWQVTSDVEAGKLGEHLLSLRGSADDDATPDDLLTEVLLKQGYSLTEQISKVDVAGLELHSVGDGLVLAYLNEHVKPTLEQFRSVVDSGPSRLIVLEDAYQGDDQLKTNLEQLCKSKSIELWRA